MKKQGMYSFLPRKIQDRTSYLNPINFIYNFESCYTSENFFLRDKILSYRAAAKFQKEVVQGDSSWFSIEPSVAFEDLNANSYFLAPQKRPRDQLSMNDFRVVQHEYVKFAWDSLTQLEVDLGDFLLTRNRVIADSRPEHLNDPMNYFFLDIKRMIRLMSRETNTDLIADTMSSILHYINYVETELPFDSQDRMFISQLRESVNKKVLPQIKEKMGSENLKLKLTTLIDEIDRVADTCQRELHYDFQDTEISPHVTQLAMQIDEAEIVKHPLQALMGCAHGKSNSKAVSTFRGKKQTLAFKQEQDLNGIFSLDVLERCKNMHLMSGLSADEKSAYVQLASSINEFIKHKSLLRSLVGFIDDVGQYQVLMGYQSDLSNFLQTIKESIATAQETRAFLASANLAIKNSLLNTHHQQSSFTKLYGYVGELVGMTERSINAENFMRNQDVKQLTSIRDPERTFEVATNVIEQTLDAMTKWRADYTDGSALLQLSGNYQQLISDIKLLSEPALLTIGAPMMDDISEDDNDIEFKNDAETEMPEWLEEDDYKALSEKNRQSGSQYLVLPQITSLQVSSTSLYLTGTTFEQHQETESFDPVASQLVGQMALAGVMLLLLGKVFHWQFYGKRERDIKSDPMVTQASNLHGFFSSKQSSERLAIADEPKNNCKKSSCLDV